VREVGGGENAGRGRHPKVRDVSGMPVREVHDPSLTRECPGREVVTELVLLEMSVESLNEVVVQSLGQAILGSAGEDLEGQKHWVPDDAARQQPPTAKFFERGDGELADKGEQGGEL
jgi:hypothetical protein